MTQFNFTTIQTKNQQNLKALDAGGTTDYVFTMAGRQPLLLIGKGHDATTVHAVQADHTAYHGTITIKKGGMTTGPGELTVTGCSGRRHEFETAIARFSKKKVIFK